MNNQLMKIAGAFAPVIFIAGCGIFGSYNSQPPPPSSYPISRPQIPVVVSPVAARNIPDTGDLRNFSCQRHEPSKRGERAFFGVRVNSCRGSGQPDGVYVTGYFYLNGTSPVNKAKILTGERILKIKGCSINNRGDARIQIEETAPGSIVMIEVRDKFGGTRSVDVKTIAHTPSLGDTPGRTPSNYDDCNNIGMRQY